MTIGDTWIATSCLAADLTSGDGDRSQVIREAILAGWEAANRYTVVFQSDLLPLPTWLVDPTSTSVRARPRVVLHLP